MSECTEKVQDVRSVASATNGSRAKTEDEGRLKQNLHPVVTGHLLLLPVAIVGAAHVLSRNNQN